MKRKFALIIAAILMMLIAISRSLGGIALYVKGNKLVTDVPIIASFLQTKMVAIGLICVGILLIYAAIVLLITFSKRSWNTSLYAIIVFFVLGIINGFVLFGKPIDQGQIINLIAVLFVTVFLYLGKPALSTNE